MEVDAGKSLLARFFTPEGESMGPPLNVPSSISVDQLSTLLNDHVLKNVRLFASLLFRPDVLESRRKTGIGLETLEEPYSDLSPVQFRFICML